MATLRLSGQPSGQTIFEFEKCELEVKLHFGSFVSAGGKSRSAAALLLVVYHLQQSLRLRRIGFHSAQTNASSVPPAYFP